MIKTLKKAMTCPQCRNKNTYLMKKESKDWEDVELAIVLRFDIMLIVRV